MTVVAVLADPARPGLVCQSLVESTPLSAAEAADLYAASLRDVVAAVAGSGGDLLVNYRPDDLLPDEHVDPDESAESAVRSLVAEVGDPDDVRFEKQVGSTESARVGNTVTHLLREEDATSAAVVRPTAALMGRTEIDSAAMKLRSSPVVLGPGSGHEVYYAGFTDPIDFEDAFATPELGTLTDRGRDEDLDVDFLPAIPTLEAPEGLLATVAQVRARVAAEKPVPGFTAETIADLDLDVATVDGEPTVVRG